MRHALLNALVLMVLYVGSTAANAQQVYKCGASYSQTPCPDGVVIDATDARTKEQKKQADLATERDERMAAAMEKARLQQEKERLQKEKANRVAPTPKVKAKTAKSANKLSASKAKKKVSKYLTVQTVAKKKKTPKKTTTKPDPNQS